MTQTTVTFSLEDFLSDFKSDISKQFTELNKRFDDLQKDVNQLKVDLAEVKTELKFIKENTVTQKNQIWSLITILAVAVLGILATGAKIAFFP